MAKLSTYPEAVAEALRDFITKKREHGICTNTMCHNMAAPDIDRCESCRERNSQRCKRHYLKQKAKREEG